MLDFIWRGKMVFSSIIFLCGFMPVVFILYYICPNRFRNVLLLIASLIFYAWGEPKYILIMLFSTVFDYCNGRLIEHFRDKENKRGAKTVLIISVVGNIGILAFFKYTDFLLETVNYISGLNISLLEIALPIGISFYTFQTMSYTIDVYRGHVKAQRNILDFATYVCMFPQLIAGPIVRYQSVERELHERSANAYDVATGLKRFVFGLGKKVILANQAGEIWNQIQAVSLSEMSVTLAWLGAVAYTFQIYFDFSGYSDMAIGMGQMMGFDFPENFNYPYISKSITEFWRRWHISLSTWFKEYVYIPLGGNRCGISRQAVNLTVTWLLTGLWHGAEWNFVLWGVYYFIILLMEKWFLLDFLKKVPKITGHIYAMFIVIIGWVIFACEDFGFLGRYLQSMFGYKVCFINGLSKYAWSTNIILLIILAIASTEFPKKLLFKIEGIFAGKHPTIDKFYGEEIHFIITGIMSLAILIVSLSLIVNGSYNPFLYFRF